MSQSYPPRALNRVEDISVPGGVRNEDFRRGSRTTGAKTSPI